MTVNSSGPPAPKVFISYSWDDDPHIAWVRDLATRLRSQGGVDVTLDRWHAVPGDQLPAFMERAIRENDYVLIVCTPNYKERSDSRIGGVGYEGDIMTAEIFSSQSPQTHRKFIPIHRCGKWDEAAPSWLKGKYRIDLRSEPYSETSYEDLLSTLHNARSQAPPIGPRPDFSAKLQPPKGVTPQVPIAEGPEAPIGIKGVIVDEVGYPKNDGTRGSALYSVPLQLSRRPSLEWAELFVQTWDRPPEFSTMHRPGISHIEGDRIVLNGTSLEEIEKYQGKTLKLVVDRVNEIIAEHERTQRSQVDEEERRRQEHRRQVEEAARHLSFDDPAPGSALSSAAQAAETAIRDGRPDLSARTKAFWKTLLADLAALDPNKGGEFDYNDFLQAVEKTKPSCLAFAGLSSVVAEWNNEPAAVALYEGFERLVAKYRQPRGWGGEWDPRLYDFYKFVGHELCATLFAMLIRERRWEIVARLLKEGIHVDNHPSRKPELVTFEYVGQSVMFFQNQDVRHFSRSHSTHADVLHERHTEGELGDLVPMRDFMNAEYFLNLRSVAAGSCEEHSYAFRWVPESVRYLSQAPDYLAKAKQVRNAEQLLQPVGVPDIPALREAVQKQKAFVLKMFGGSHVPYGLAEIDPDSIGTR